MPDLNPQPLPPRIELSAFAETVSVAVLRALESQNTANSPFRNPRLIWGFILEPQILPQAGEEQQ
jgi:hypothetical protein